jgi:hypothetical protein
MMVWSARIRRQDRFQEPVNASSTSESPLLGGHATGLMTANVSAGPGAATSAATSLPSLSSLAWR